MCTSAISLSGNLPKLMTAFRKLRRDQILITIYSEPFHTGPYGYKMRLELHPNGRNDGLNTHLSIFVRLMKSEYDGILPWPFDKKVTITLIDQQPCPKLRRNIHMCSYPRNDGHFSPCYSRPVEERAQNIAFGFCKFVTQEQLKTRHYIVSDTLFFCVEVDTLTFMAIVIPVLEKETGLCGKN